MDFSLPERVRDARRILEDFVKREVEPLERDVLAKGFRASLPILERARARARETGLWAASLPKEWGGAGLSLTEFAHVSEMLGRSPLGHYVFNCQAPDIGNMELLLRYGNDEQRERYLRPLAQGKMRSCFAMTEPEFAGSNPIVMGTTAKKQGSDYVISGHKWFTSGADGAGFAVVMAVSDPEAHPYGRASQIIVPAGTEGFEVLPNLRVMGERGEDWASHGEVMFHSCRVPQTNRIGEEGAGFMLAQERLGPGRIHHCMRWIGICERAFELMCQRAATRELSKGKPLGTRQFVQDWVAESRAEIDGARLLVLHTAWRIDAEGSYAARNEISLIKFSVAGVLQRVLDRAIQTHGALGITDDTPLAFWWRHERGARIYDGPDEVHKALVARRLLEAHGLTR